MRDGMRRLALAAAAVAGVVVIALMARDATSAATQRLVVFEAFNSPG